MKKVIWLAVLSAVPVLAQAGVVVQEPGQVPIPATHHIVIPKVPTLPQTTQELNAAPADMPAPATAAQTAAANPANTLPPLPPEKSLYQSAAHSLLPLKPGDLVKFRKKLNETQKASEEPVTSPLVKTEIITIHPNRGAVPSIPMSAGYVTDITFVNEWGQPWNVSDATVGNGTAFQVMNPVTPGTIQGIAPLPGKKAGKASGGTGHSAYPTSTIIIASKEKYRDSNLSVLLHQLPIPLLFNLQTGGNSVDYRIIARIDALPANAMPPVGGIVRSHDSADAILMRALYDTMPQSAKPVPFGYGEAWNLNGKLWLRTRYSVLAPAWEATMQSPDGVQAYELPDTQSVMLMINGEPQTLVLEDRKGENHE